MRILAVVKMNDSEAFVLDESPGLLYTKLNARTIVGTDGVFCDCLVYERPSQHFKAFGGREFTLKLTDGTKEHCNGQWWSGVSQDARDVLGDVGGVAACGIDALRRCYVFSGFTVIVQELKKLRAAYAGPVYDYWEFEKMLKSGWGPDATRQVKTELAKVKP